MLIEFWRRDISEEERKKEIIRKAQAKLERQQKA